MMRFELVKCLHYITKPGWEETSSCLGGLKFLTKVNKRPLCSLREKTVKAVKWQEATKEK